MSTDTNKKKGLSFYGILKTVFLLLIIASVAPQIIKNLVTNVQETVQPKVHVGYIKIHGFIKDSSFYSKRIEEFEKDDDIKALLVKVDSPGGVPGAAQALYNELNKFKKKKPIVVLVENVCASAAYYIASAANTIVSNPSSLVGSIGVLMQMANVKELLNSWKIYPSYIQSGKFKTAGSPVKEMTPEEKQYLQNLSDSAYKQFTQDIANSRKLSLTKKSQWADGKIFTGTQALKLKLIDKIGSYRDAKDTIKELAKIDKDKEIKFIPATKVSGLKKLLVGEEDYGSGAQEHAQSLGTFLSYVYKSFIHAQTTENHVSMN